MTVHIRPIAPLDLRDPITGPDRQPPAAGAPRPLSITPPGFTRAVKAAVRAA